MWSDCSTSSSSDVPLLGCYLLLPTSWGLDVAEMCQGGQENRLSGPEHLWFMVGCQPPAKMSKARFSASWSLWTLTDLRWVTQPMSATSGPFKGPEGSAARAGSVDPESPAFPWMTAFGSYLGSAQELTPGGREHRSSDFFRNQLLPRKGNSLKWGWEEKGVWSGSIMFRIPMSRIIPKMLKT